ncbi:hypothetical protein LEP1GSC137_0140 [Leptospira borgpetersenii str. Noumea 25]|uniref:Uncharacterized protein n=2 Tax=Leptospira borgpetersenii TaxID=174 RepID=M3H266_LEPBO|nr:hypothetical protein LBBP_04216 [Leptospira borgpetersenii serovar Ballum]EKR01224.1 hypothetical protein LEP1GSC121_1442 [Leptospira borgpetersenii serovar Castellonis str. 200801910]EMG01179.1 hypothetical protein LEP1GSC123_1024 [Leptospira borgpetersenii str. 200701203]EMO10001.1 hypothetical protein LEP1GSC137_0140 [Leptospira borgpetersenii str. Noumea 25]
MKTFTDGKKCFIEIRLQTDASSCEWLELRTCPKTECRNFLDVSG